MNITSIMQSSRSSIRVYIIVALFLLLVGCTLNLPTPTLAPTVTASPRPPTNTPTASPVPTLAPSATWTATDAATFTPSASPTITLTPAPTWTAWLVNMDWSTGLPLIIDPKNPHQNCMLSYFDLSPAPGHLGVWRKDNGGYNSCEAQIRSQP